MNIISVGNTRNCSTRKLPGDGKPVVSIRLERTSHGDFAVTPTACHSDAKAWVVWVRSTIGICKSFCRHAWIILAIHHLQRPWISLKKGFIVVAFTHSIDEAIGEITVTRSTQGRNRCRQQGRIKRNRPWNSFIAFTNGSAVLTQFGGLVPSIGGLSNTSRNAGCYRGTTNLKVNGVCGVSFATGSTGNHLQLTGTFDLFGGNVINSRVKNTGNQ